MVLNGGDGRGGSGETRIAAQCVVVTAPVPVLSGTAGARLEFQPPLPDSKRQALAAVGVGLASAAVNALARCSTEPPSQLAWEEVPLI